MSYPWDGVTYLEKIQKDKTVCSKIENAYYTLLRKWCRDHHTDEVSLSLEDRFHLLAEAITLCDDGGAYINDDYSHFMRDVLDCLLKREYSPWADKEDNDEN